MTKSGKNSRNFFSNTWAIFWAATSAADAVEGRRRPNNRDLRLLGINPDQFDKIK